MGVRIKCPVCETLSFFDHVTANGIANATSIECSFFACRHIMTPAEQVAEMRRQRRNAQSRGHRWDRAVAKQGAVPADGRLASACEWNRDLIRGLDHEIAWFLSQYPEVT